ncbi:MAG: hypothetical protein GEV06_08055 [Luteitalea sp.]|nr:hypothetical protein [Luteitalea sp.]
MNAKAICVLLVLVLCMAAPLRSQVLLEDEVEAMQQAQFDEIDEYLDRQVERADSLRRAYWQRDLSSIAAYEESIEPYRDELFEMLGGNAYRESPLAPTEKLIAEFPTHKAYRVWITAFDDVHVYGVLLVPNGRGPFPALITVHGMAGTPEGVTGLTEDEDYHNRFGLQAVKRQYAVFAPVNMNSAAKRSWLDRKAIMVRQPQYEMFEGAHEVFGGKTFGFFERWLKGGVDQ